MKFIIEKLDHHGRGIAHIDGKVIFVENALPGEEVELEITKETAKYMEGTVKNYFKQSERRVKSKCPFYEKCGGCHLRHMSYEDTLQFKKTKIEDIFRKFVGITPKIEIIKNKNKDFYRNKIELICLDGKYGFYKKGSHDLVELDRCLNAEECINDVLRSLDFFHLKNGRLTIKSNYNGEILLNIESDDPSKIDIEMLRAKFKLVGIVYNRSLIFGADHFVEIVDGKLFKETYNSFFQVNRYINEELFKIVEREIDPLAVVADMCSGVGTLSVVAASKAKKVYSLEIVENAVKDGLLNAKMNKKTNIEFMLGDAYSNIGKIKAHLNTILIDPPRSGLNKQALETILKIKPEKIIYIACDPVTLSRDIKVLSSDYDIQKVYLLDMFSYTYHVECVCVLNRR